ncbi:Protein kinase of the Mitotic Exit Network [Thecaphora frezii]
MAAVTAAAVPALDFSASQSMDLEGTTASLAEFGMASGSRRMAYDASPRRPHSSGNPLPKLKPIEVAQKRAIRATGQAPPPILGRKVYNVVNHDPGCDEADLLSTSAVYSAAVSSALSSSRPSSRARNRREADDSRSRSPSSVRAPETEAEDLSEEEVVLDLPSPAEPTARPRRMQSRETHRNPVTLTNLQMASLSTPELHLASDPMLDTEEPSFLRRLGRASPSKAPSPSHGNDETDGPSGSQLHTRTRSSELSTNQVAGVAYASFSAAMNAVETDARPMIPAAYSQGKERSKTSAGAGVAHSASRDGAGSPPLWQNGNPSTETLGPASRSLEGVQSRSSTSAAAAASATAAASAIGNAYPWFQRQRRWSVNTRSPELRASSIVDTEDGSTQLSSAISGTSIATEGTGTTHLSDSNPSAGNGSTDTSQGVDQVQTLGLSLDSLRAARAYLVRELKQLTPSEMGEDGDRITNLASSVESEAEVNTAGEGNTDPTREMFEFWKCISDGVLLCLLANRVRPGCVDRIDRRNVEWAKADNISRFLRAARDHLGLRSKDLFQTLDLTDATVEGLLRASHTLLTIERCSRSALHVRPYRPSETTFAEISGRLSPPPTPKPRPESLESSPDRDSNHQRALAAIQKNRREAERILVSSARPESIVADASVKSRRRRSGDPGGSVLPVYKMRGASITFADNVKAPSTSNDEENRMPYRDRRLSESAISLTGVAEEEVEEENGQPSRLVERPSTSPSNVGPSDSRRGSSDSEKPARVGSAVHGNSPLMRSFSQRRISAELGLGQLSRSVIGSAENLVDYTQLSHSSPSRIPPARRHSARIQMGPSMLNPSRESLLALNATSGADGEGSLAPGNVPRVPFPKSALQSSDSSGSRRIGRHLSLNAGSHSGDAISLASSASASFMHVSPKLSSRPPYRHMRFSSDLHVPSMARPISVGRSPELFSDERSFAGSSRIRLDSEAGSLYTNTLGSSTHDEGSSGVSRMSREPSVAPSSKHKLVVVEEGKPNVTYQLGNCIGRGQFGSVYRALNLNSGRMVAVKRIKLEGRSDEDVTQLMNEVDLLKSLTHPSVVKYEGLVRGPEVVSIILEYVENGSLLHTLKAFGNFPEKLVASYVVKILEGLNYLHEQNVVHCDLKAANILTTKNGNVKLSDFGVSLNLKAVEKMNNKNNDAIGTPNWMAPEVIELKGVTTAADIWSLGCTVIELLTGKPPYYDMLAMSAMFRIVEDDCPPIPEKCSPPLREMLLQCFNKDPSLRPSAETLFEHDWVRQTWTGHKELRPQDSVPFLRRISADLRKLDPNMFNKDLKVQQAFMERSTSSPPPTLTRPDLNDMRANTMPAGAAEDSAQTPMGSPPTGSMPLPSLEETSTSQKPAEESRSPDAGPLSSGLLPLQDPSLLDLHSMDEPGKPHAFVKSTFSKAVRCKICSEPVKKHAVLCEECGLVCHARCAGHAPSSCNLRAQLLMFHARASMDQPRVASPAPSVATGTQAQPASPIFSSPTSPSLSASTSFRFPFAIKRTSKLSNAEVPAPALRISNDQYGVDGSAMLSVATVSRGQVPVKAADKAANQGSAQRRRRISLLPGRQRSPSPDGALHPASVNSSHSGLHGPRRPSSLSYGSASGASSISSQSGALMLKSTSDTSSSGQQHQLGLHQQGISTPHLSVHGSHDSQADPTRFRRRLSSGFGLGHSDLSLGGHAAGGRSASHSATLRTGPPQGPALGHQTPMPTLGEKRRSKRNSSRSDCVVM